MNSEDTLGLWYEFGKYPSPKDWEESNHTMLSSASSYTGLLSVFMGWEIS